MHYTMKQLSLIFLALIFLAGCSGVQKTPEPRYPKINSGDSERKSGRAMLFYEQAEKDLDINESVIVIPPDEKKKEVSSETGSATKQ